MLASQGNARSRFDCGIEVFTVVFLVITHILLLSG